MGTREPTFFKGVFCGPRWVFPEREAGDKIGGEGKGEEKFSPPFVFFRVKRGGGKGKKKREGGRRTLFFCVAAHQREGGGGPLKFIFSQKKERRTARFDATQIRGRALGKERRGNIIAKHNIKQEGEGGEKFIQKDGGVNNRDQMECVGKK